MTLAVREERYGSRESMRYMILIVLFALAACAAPSSPDLDRCLDGATMVQNERAFACDGPRGCYLLPLGGSACDESVTIEDLPCGEPWQLWCGSGEVLRCEPTAEGDRWRSFNPCPGGCWTSPLRCAPAR